MLAENYNVHDKYFIAEVWSFSANIHICPCVVVMSSQKCQGCEFCPCGDACSLRSPRHDAQMKGTMCGSARWEFCGVEHWPTLCCDHQDCLCLCISWGPRWGRQKHIFTIETNKVSLLYIHSLWVLLRFSTTVQKLCSMLR